MTVTVSTLPNGLRVLTDAMPHIETTALGIWVGSGSRHETAAQHGLSHFLEHMAFKGTRRRSARAIAEEIESAGGDLNAGTSTEQTAYYARVLAADTGLALDILADILTDSSFDPAEMEREKSVVIQEIAAVEDTPDDLVFEMLTRTAYPDQAIGRAILGTPDSVAGFSRDAIADYVASQYGAGNMIVAAAGAIDHERFCDDVAKQLSGVPATPHRAAVTARYVGGDAREKRRLEQAHVTVAFEAFSFRDPRHYAAHIFSHAVGGGMSSRLFQTVREERGLTYSIHSFDWTYEDTGLFGFYAATSAAQVAELMPVALDCLAETTETLTEAEVARAKAQLKVSLLTALESSSARAEQIARQHMAFGRIIPGHEIIAKVDAITLAEAKAIGAAMLATPPTVAAIGPVGKVPTPERIAARFRGLATRSDLELA
ncbi:pitrilysin family protein [Lichenihabitans sp. Uapishka_5]|uniref:M16 family metallopeptidase n=1 Tax=Lichenihabitans sp. Uapishka_5 TaxID=3037302 RepID=UPI0029E80CFF|nr:pitrilysin family protein [Lichenihabitans sp. Uapishka_5]MDX7949754.1 pitrilysin family protein [Lichenihabitans sp. Uapishka_5]